MPQDHYRNHNFLPLQKEISEKERAVLQAINEGIEKLYRDELEKLKANPEKKLTSQIGRQEDQTPVDKEKLLNGL